MLGLVEHAVLLQWTPLGRGQGDAVVYGLLGVLLGVLLTGALMAYFVRRHLLKNPSLTLPLRGSRATDWEWKPPCPFPLISRDSFGEWIAVHNADREVLQSALGVKRVVPLCWQSVEQVYEGRGLIFSPPIRGWTLAMGPGLHRWTHDVDECFKWLTGLSGELNMIQYFHFHRALHHHGWIYTANGRVLRAYSWDGDGVWSQGSPTWIEKRVKANFQPMGFGPEQAVFVQQTLMDNVDKLFEIAGHWSVDPSRVDARLFEKHSLWAADASA